MLAPLLQRRGILKQIVSDRNGKREPLRGFGTTSELKGESKRI